MRRFAPVSPPPDWETTVLEPGFEWLEKNRNARRPRDLWSDYREDLASRGFNDLCGYTVMYTPNGTVDHFVSWSEIRGTPRAQMAYEWSNLRYAAGWFNSARKSMVVPDPHRVEDDWFELLLPSLQLVATDRVPATEKTAVNNALRWLMKDQRVIRQRRKWFELYRSRKLSLEGLDEVAPLISRALRKDPEFLRPSDRDSLEPARG